jgi:hypothetical protein
MKVPIYRAIPKSVETTRAVAHKWLRLQLTRLQKPLFTIWLRWLGLAIDLESSQELFDHWLDELPEQGRGR